MTRALTAEILLSGYAQGVFPMAESRDDDQLHWLDPRQRGVFPLDAFHLSQSLRRRIRRENYQVRTNTAFNDVVSACASRQDTWINAPLTRLYEALHRRGHAQSLEVWQDGALAGGVFGVTLGAAFFGESMFSARTDGSKIALAYLVDRLRVAGFSLFDTQFLTPHLASLGAIEIPRAEYRALLAEALIKVADFAAPGAAPTAQVLLHRCNQIS
ncbi:MAG: leucyl/phenylalanyl-tRNA--protein transferase [Albidovulum sp.]